MALEKTERAVDGNAVNPGVEFACVAKNLRSIEVLLCGFYDAQYGSTLMRETNAA